MESPIEKAKRLGVPVIGGARQFSSSPHSPIGVCGKCGLELMRVMGYSCSRAGCPTGLGGTTSLVSA